MKRKNPIVAALLNVFIVGLGHAYLGLWFKAVFLFLTTVVVAFFSLGFGYFLPMFFAVVDGYICAKRINEGTPINELKYSLQFG